MVAEYLPKTISSVLCRLLKQHKAATNAVIVAGNDSMNIETHLLQKSRSFFFPEFSDHFGPKGALANLLLKVFGGLRRKR
jgi:hypothetical protein